MEANSVKYDKIADRYDDILAEDGVAAINRGRFQKLVLSYVPLHHLLVDFGAGTGIDAGIYARQGYEVVLFEPSEGMREVARQKLVNSRLSGNVKIVDGDLDTMLEFISGQTRNVSIVSNFGPLNHLRHEDNELDRLASAVSPGGYFIHYILKPFYIDFVRQPSYRSGFGKLLLGGIHSLEDDNIDLRLFRVKYLENRLSNAFRLLKTVQSQSRLFGGRYSRFGSRVFAPLLRRSVFVVFQKREISHAQESKF